MTRSEREVFEAAIKRYGEAQQLVVLFEEMSELQKAICKAIRYNKNQFYNSIAEEMADVRIMLDQAELIFGCHDDSEMWRLDKVVRLKERLGMLTEER